MSLTLCIPGRPANLNDRQHWRARHRTTQEIQRHAYACALEQWGHAAAARKRLTFPCVVTVTDHCRTANLRDTMNAAPHVKHIIDGLVKLYGLMPDDAGKWVSDIRFRPAVKTGTDQLVLTFEGAGA